MPKIGVDNRKVIKKVLLETGLTTSSAELLLNYVDGDSNQKEASGLDEIHRQVLKELKKAKKKGIRFSEADLQGFLGQDEIPPEFREFLGNVKS